jgi:hypothetical protein
MKVCDADATARALPWRALLEAIEQTLLASGWPRRVARSLGAAARAGTS